MGKKQEVIKIDATSLFNSMAAALTTCDRELSKQLRSLDDLSIDELEELNDYLQFSGSIHYNAIIDNMAWDIQAVVEQELWERQRQQACSLDDRLQTENEAALHELLRCGW